MENIKLTVPGNPISVNHYLGNFVQGKRVVRFKTKKAKDYQKLIESLYEHKTLTKDKQLKVNIKLYFGDKRRRDIDNYNKTILDSMEGIVYEDDCQIKKLVVEKFVDKDNPRVEITIMEVG